MADAIETVRVWLEHGRKSFGETIPADALDEVVKLAASAERLAVTVRRIYAEQLPDTWFVCGEGGPKDRNGLPHTIHVCPAYGVSWSEIYERRVA